MPNDSKPVPWHLLALPLIPALGAGFGALVNTLGGEPDPIDARTRALAARLIAHRVALDAHFDVAGFRLAPAQTPKGAAETAAQTFLAENATMDPGELTRRAYAVALRAGGARQASLDATLDAMRTAASVRPELADLASRPARRASVAAFKAGESAALAALSPLMVQGGTWSTELMQRAYQAALGAGHEAIERARGRAT